jgi:drug/metabolite transporter (DMT)-like permease
MGALLALGASLAWGCADFAGGLAARRIGSLRTVVVSYPAGAVLLTVFALTLVPGTIDAEVFAWAAAVGIVGVIAMFLLYGALAAGPMGIISPLTALGGAAVPVAVGIARGETLTTLVVLGIVLAVLAVVLVSREPGPHRQVTTRALALSAGAGLFIGLYLTGLGLAPVSSGIWVTTLGRWFASGLVIIIALAVTTREGRSTWTPYPWALVLAAGFLDSLANGFFQLAAQMAELVVVAVIGALYPAATLLLAHWFLGERMTRIQALGVGLALAAAVTLTV